MDGEEQEPQDEELLDSVDEEEDDDFPEYANQQNKELHQIVFRYLFKILTLLDSREEKIDQRISRKD